MLVQIEEQKGGRLLEVAVALVVEHLGVELRIDAQVQIAYGSLVGKVHANRFLLLLALHRQVLTRLC